MPQPPAVGSDTQLQDLIDPVLTGRGLAFVSVGLGRRFYTAAYTSFYTGDLHQSRRRKPFSSRHLQVGLTGFEPATSWSRTYGPCLESPGKQAVSATDPEPVTKIVTSNPPTPLPLLELLTQLAALPAEQRAALAALLNPATVHRSPALDSDRCPLDDLQEGAK